MINSPAIKNLAIAYEALSRCAGAEDFLNRVSSLLTRVIREAEEEQRDQSPYTKPQRTNLDEEIPF